jgi:hypothetical protein
MEQCGAVLCRSERTYSVVLFVLSINAFWLCQILVPTLFLISFTRLSLFHNFPYFVLASDCMLAYTQELYLGHLPIPSLPISSPLPFHTFFYSPQYQPSKIPTVPTPFLPYRPQIPSHFYCHVLSYHWLTWPFTASHVLINSSTHAHIYRPTYMHTHANTPPPINTCMPTLHAISRVYWCYRSNQNRTAFITAVCQYSTHDYILCYSFHIF